MEEVNPVDMVRALRAMGYSSTQIREMAGNFDLDGNNAPSRSLARPEPMVYIVEGEVVGIEYPDGKFVRGKGDPGREPIVGNFSSYGPGSVKKIRR